MKMIFEYVLLYNCGILIKVRHLIKSSFITSNDLINQKSDEVLENVNKLIITVNVNMSASYQR
jgi:hypothetical protein